MARYDIKFGGKVGDARMFGELSLDSATPLDDAKIEWLRAHAVQIAGELVAGGMRFHPAELAPFSAALAARVAEAVPGANVSVRATAPGSPA